MAKYYYIDKDGNKTQYHGKVFTDLTTNEKYGELIEYNIYDQKIKLDFHEAVPGNEGWNSYFGYVDDDGKLCKYDGKDIRKSINNTYFAVNVEKNEVLLNKKDGIKGYSSYFSYIDNGVEKIYNGPYPNFSKALKSYYIFI